MTCPMCDCEMDQNCYAEVCTRGDGPINDLPLSAGPGGYCHQCELFVFERDGDDK